jgi:hypothetical protein
MKGWPLEEQERDMNNDCELNIGELDHAALDAVTGGFCGFYLPASQDDKKQADAIKGFQQMLQEI